MLSLRLCVQRPKASLNEFFLSKICFIKSGVNVMNIRVAEIRGALLWFNIGKNCPLISLPDAAFDF